MSVQTEPRGLLIGRQVGGCGRGARVVLGLLGLVYTGLQVAHLGGTTGVIARLAGGFLATTALYLALFWLLGKRVSQPWLRTVIFWLPAIFILLPGGWGLGVLLYWSGACLLTALVSYGGCEVVALPSLLFGRYDTVYCPLNAIDLIERRSTRPGRPGIESGQGSPLR